MPRTPKPVDPTAPEQSVSVSLPTELVARLDAAASERVVGRGFLLRYFIEQGMTNLPALPRNRAYRTLRDLIDDRPENPTELYSTPSLPTIAPESHTGTTEVPEPSTGTSE